MAKSAILAGIVAVVGVFLYAPNSVKADPAGWIEEEDVRFTQIQNASPGYMDPPTLYGGSGNRYCSYQNIETKLPTGNWADFFQQKQVVEKCAVETIFGTTDGDILVAAGTNTGGKLKLRSNKEFLLAGSNLRAGITYNGTNLQAGTAHIYHSNSLLSNLKVKVNNDRTVEYELQGDGGLSQLFNEKGAPLQFRISTSAYSSNANWLVFDSPNYGLVRVDTDTGEILSFGNPTNYSRNDPAYKMAVSSDGRYVIVSAVNRLDIYDLNNCVAQTGTLSYLKKCKVRSLEQERKNQANFGWSAAKIRFTSDKSFIYYVTDNVNGVLEKRLYKVSLGEVPDFGFDYLGLGDSFASGEGAFGYKSITDNAGNMCHVSLLSYPYLIGNKTNAERYESIACSGAKIRDIDQYENSKYTGQHGVAEDGIEQGARDITEITRLYIPGKVTQNFILSKINSEKVTVSIGGNDINFSGKLTECIVNILNSTCFDTYEDRVEAILEVQKVIPNLRNIYQKLKENNRRVYVVGYPSIIAPNGNCANNVKLNEKEVEFALTLTSLLNNAIETAAKQAGVVYVDVESIFHGKRLCEAESENTVVHGITQGDTAGPWIFKVLARESFHPKVTGHLLYSDTILVQTENLTKPMPISNLDSKFTPPDLSSPYWDEEKTGRQIFTPRYIQIWDDLLKGGNIDYVLSGKDTGFMPESEVKVEIHTEPVRMGVYQTDQAGNLRVSFVFPENLEPGYHSIHFYGTDILGQPVDAYDYFFVRATANDFDGDGIKDQDEGCILVEPIGADRDQDGVDDACDGFENPLPEPPQNVGVLPVPQFDSISPPKDETFNNPETVAGHEEINNPEPVQNPVTVETANTSGSTGTPIVLASTNNDQDESEADGEVLSEQNTNTDRQIDPVTVDESRVGESSVNQTVNNPKVYWWYLAAGTLAFIGLVAFIVYTRRM